MVKVSPRHGAGLLLVLLQWVHRPGPLVCPHELHRPLSHVLLLRSQGNEVDLHFINILCPVYGAIWSLMMSEYEYHGVWPWWSPVCSSCRWLWVVSSTTQPLHSKLKVSRYLTHRRIFWLKWVVALQTFAWIFEDKNLPREILLFQKRYFQFLNP